MSRQVSFTFADTPPAKNLNIQSPSWFISNALLADVQYERFHYIRPSNWKDEHVTETTLPA